LTEKAVDEVPGVVDIWGLRTNADLPTAQNFAGQPGVQP
jgi:hypothetical protein